jgi:UDP-4-amino-4,6-dideoxy-N-acetyl-beta-L-altrosamine transaminase
MIPYGRQTIEDDDVAAVAEAMRSGFLTTGPAVEAFERAFREHTGAADAVACANGTAALHLTTMALGLRPGDVAIVPAMTFLSTANAVGFQGARVVFADVDPETGLMRPEDLDEALDRGRHLGEVKAVLAVHLNGQCADMPRIAERARAAGAAVVEDSCHAIGGHTTGPDGGPTPVGSCAFADMASFSFHPVKTITMGEGGAVTFADPDLAAAVRRLRTHGMERKPERFQRRDAAFGADGQPHPWFYEMQQLGHNFRASDVQCALGLSQLRKLDRFVAARRSLSARYDGQLAPLSPTVRPIARRTGEAERPAWHLYAVLIDYAAAGTTRARLMHALREEGIGTQVHYIPVPEQPYWAARTDRRTFPGAQAYYRQVLSLPLFPAMAEADVDRVVDALARHLGQGH